MAHAASPLTTEDAERITEKQLAAKSDVFGEFYRPFLVEGAQSLLEFSSTWSERHPGTVDFPQLADSAIAAVLAGHSAIGVRTLITAFHAARQAEQTPPSYAGFHARIGSEGGRQELAKEFPELPRLLRLLTQHRLSQIRAVVEAARRDSTVLAERFGTGGPVVAISAGLGDSHRGGQTVCFVTWENGVKLVYKPQARSTYRLLRSVLGIIEDADAFFGPVCPETVEGERHLWQQPVRYSESADTAEASEYFRRFGRCAALFSMFGAGDLHHENVIATRHGPVVVDLETLVSLPTPVAHQPGRDLAADVEESVLSSFLFPARYPGEMIDMDLSALGSTRSEPSERLTSFSVVDAGTDNIRFDSEPTSIPPGQNVARLNGARLDPREWTEVIVSGFREGRERLSAVREDVSAAIGKADEWRVRQLLRPTFVYARFLEASTHPTHMGDRADRMRLFDRLPRRHRGLKQSVTEEVVAQETAALADLDIPFFEVECDSRDLMCNGGDERVRDAVATSPRVAAAERVEGFFRRPSERDPTYIRYALSTSVDDVWSQEVRERDGRGGAASPYSLADPGEFHTALNDLALGGPERPTWLMPRLFGYSMRLDAMNPTLYEGGGLLLYLSRARDRGAAPAPDLDLSQAVKSAVPQQDRPFGAPSDASPFTGALSHRVCALELADPAAGDPAPPSSFEPGTGGPFSADDLAVDDLDYLNGFGGYLVYLAEYDDAVEPRQGGINPADLVERLVVVDGPPDEHDGDLGLAHGRFGRMAALSAGVVLGADRAGAARRHLERFTDAYLCRRWQDAALTGATESTGWCKGYAGVAFAATKVLTRLGYTRADTRDSISLEVERIVEGPTGPDISLCHGLAGRVAMLCWIADHLDWPEARTRARDLSSRFIERYGDGGWIGGVGANVYLPSFLLGLSGWHFAQLMLDDPSVGLPLCLGGR